MKDEAERKAERILIQFPDSCSPSNLLVVNAVAAALREAQRDAYSQGQEDGYLKGWTVGNEEADALDAEIVKLKAERDAAFVRGFEQGAEIEQIKNSAEITNLGAECDELKRDNEEWLRMSKRKDKIIDADIKEIANLKAERDAAVGKPYTNIVGREMLRDEFVRGLEGAKEIIRLCRTTEHYALLEESGVLDVSNAIQAEIDKARVKGE